MINKIAIGTAQFGLDYGINNTQGQVTKSEVHKILAYCQRVGIDTIDTAKLYGESEHVLGESPTNNFKIVTKLGPCGSQEVRSQLKASLDRLNKKNIFGCLIHQFDSYESDTNIFDELSALKEEGIIENVGFSVYYPHELNKILERNVAFQLIQFPMNIFDQRFDPILKTLKDRGVEVHVRSAFLQGLFFREINKIDPHFQTVKNKLQHIDEMCINHNVEKSALCLGYLMLNDHIDKIVIGVDSVDQLMTNIKSLKHMDMIAELKSELDDMSEEDERIIIPSYWNL